MTVYLAYNGTMVLTGIGLFSFTLWVGSAFGIGLSVMDEEFILHEFLLSASLRFCSGLIITGAIGFIICIVTPNQNYFFSKLTRAQKIEYCTSGISCTKVQSYALGLGEIRELGLGDDE